MSINDNIRFDLITDSQVVSEDWDKTPTINDDCTDQKQRGFFEELESL
jgi:hypothetical protein